jgi:hypothetical protein
MFCQKCGTQNPDDGKFCSKCGNDLKSTVQAERKGISSKLGKWGIPGFRSGKTWKMALATFVYFFVFLAIISGSSDKSHNNQNLQNDITPLTNPTTATETRSASTTQKATPSVTQTETPKTQIFNIGDTATNNKLKVTVNTISFVSKINEQNNEFLIAESPSGKQYAVVDITLENVLTDKTQPISTLLSTSIIDQDGYEYKIDFNGLTALDKSFKDGDILPGMKKSGRIAYLVPSAANDLKFSYKYDLLGETAIFDIK